MYVSLDSVGTEFPRTYGNAGGDCENVFCFFSGQGAGRTSSEAWIASVERENIRPTLRIQRKKNYRAPMTEQHARVLLREEVHSGNRNSNPSWQRTPRSAQVPRNEGN